MLGPIRAGKVALEGKAQQPQGEGRRSSIPKPASPSARRTSRSATSAPSGPPRAAMNSAGDFATSPPLAPRLTESTEQMTAAWFSASLVLPSSETRPNSAVLTSSDSATASLQGTDSSVSGPDSKNPGKPICQGPDRHAARQPREKSPGAAPPPVEDGERCGQELHNGGERQDREVFEAEPGIRDQLDNEARPGSPPRSAPGAGAAPSRGCRRRPGAAAGAGADNSAPCWRAPG